MSFFSDLLSGIAPVAAGFMTGGAGFAPLLAGAATGAGIAAIRGQDPLMGAVTGGFGGSAGAGLSGAAGGLGSMPNANIASGATQSANNALMGGSTIPGNFAKEYAGATAGAGTGITSGQAFKNMVSNPGQTLANYGGGDKFKGAAKLGSLGLPAVAGAMVPEYNANPDDNPMSKYDPNRRLNVGMSTGIQNALKRDSGLRLNQPFAQFAEGGYLETNMGDGMSDNIPSSIDGEQPAALSENEFVIPADVVSHIGNGSSDAGAKQLYAMMDRVRKARTGNEKQGREIMSQEYMPA
jgi:hypothetical protein